MRVITGSARGRRLETLEGEDVRPTTDRVKEAVFSIIQFETEGRVFLDLFAGSGQMGIEALSRGADSAYFVDNSKKSVETVKRNLKTTKLEDRAKVFQMDCGMNQAEYLKLQLTVNESTKEFLFEGKFKNNRNFIRKNC